MEQRILNLLGHKDYIPLSAENLRRHLRLTHRPEAEFLAGLRKLEQSGQIARIKGGRYIRPREADLIPGRIRMNRAGKGFLQPDDSDLKEIAVPEGATGTALHEDRVLVRRDVRRKGFQAGDQTPETGVVVRILERKRTQIVGTLQQGRQFLYVIPDDPRMPHDVYVPPAHDVGRPAHVGDKVVVELARMGIAPHQSRRRNRRSARPAGCGGRGHAVRAPPIRIAAAFSQGRARRGPRHRRDGACRMISLAAWIAGRIA